VTLALEQRLAMYRFSVLAAGGVIAAAAATPGQAAVISYTLPSPLTASVNGTPILFDFFTGSAALSPTPPGGLGQFELNVQQRTFPGSGDSVYHQVEPGVHVSSGSVLGPGLAARVGSGYNINGGDAFTNGGEPLFVDSNVSRNGNTYQNDKGSWSPDSPDDQGYLGFAFSNGTGTDYGWADVTLAGDGSLTLHSFGYDNSGAPIAAGATGSGGAAAPDANPLLLLAVGGAVGLAAYRVRRRGEAAAS
jgi:hypothetical protein